MSNLVEFPAQQPDVDCWGGCPRCHTHTGLRNVGPEHFICCDVHRLCWCIGSNLLSGWLHESEETHRQNETLLRTYRIVDPWFPAKVSA